MDKSLSQAQKKNLEKRYLLVESEHFHLVDYAVDREGKGMHIIYKNNFIPLAPDDINTFLDEVKKVWEHMKGVAV